MGGLRSVSMSCDGGKICTRATGALAGGTNAATRGSEGRHPTPRHPARSQGWGELPRDLSGAGICMPSHEAWRLPEAGAASAPAQSRVSVTACAGAAMPGRTRHRTRTKWNATSREGRSFTA